MKEKATLVTVILLIIFSLILVSFWANERNRAKKGLAHMAEGAQGTLYLIVEDYLLKVSPDGRLLNKMHLKDDLGISERITDIAVRKDGTFLIGLHESHQIGMYSSEGKIIRIHNVEPTSFDFMMTLDSSNDFLYVSFSGSLQGYIQVFGPELQFISSISEFINPDKPQPEKDFMDYEEDTETDVMENYRDYFDPADILYYDDRLHIADGKRIVILRTDGTLDRIISLPFENVNVGTSALAWKNWTKT